MMSNNTVNEITELSVCKSESNDGATSTDEKTVISTKYAPTTSASIAGSGTRIAEIVDGGSKCINSEQNSTMTSLKRSREEDCSEQNSTMTSLKHSREEDCVSVPSKIICTENLLGKTVAGHYNKLEEKGLDVRNQSDILFMRNFNNWIKSYLINKHMQDVRDSVPSDQRIVVLDLGCGKGGDLLKWSKTNIRHLVCVDIAETSMNQCQDRYDCSKRRRHGGPTFSAEFIVADCTKVCFQHLLRDPSMKLHLTSCQFAFHYCFESLRQAETMIKNAAANMCSGGYFILTIPDANYIMKRISESKDGISFGNELFRIDFPADRDASAPPLFGDKYHFYLNGVVNCPEFLVHQPTLKKLCSAYGLTCVYEKRFRDVYQEALVEPQSKNLMYRMNALELYPSENGEQNRDVSEYETARQHLQDTNQQTVLTMSASEWEAVNVYTAFAFKKA